MTTASLGFRRLGVPVADWVWIVAFALFRFIIAARHGLGVDESHYALYGLRPDWSYFDHPPLGGWINAVFLAILGRNDLAVRLPAILCGIASSLLIFRMLETWLGDVRAARWGTLALNASFLFQALWIMFLPDTILLVLVLWLIAIVQRLLTGERKPDETDWHAWIQLGLCLGLCGLAKYTAAFFVVSLLGVLATERAFRRVQIKGLLVAIAVAGATVSPVFIWNIQHDWISFKYQTGHVVGGEKAHLSLQRFGQFLVVQMAAYSPFALVAAALGWIGSRQRWGLTGRLLLWMIAPTFLFFAYTYAREEGLPHWTLICMALFIPTGVALSAASLSRFRWARGLTTASLVVIVVLLSELAFPFIHFPEYQSPYADLTGWKDLGRQIRQIALHEPSPFSIGTTNWTLGGRADFYLSDIAPTYVLDDRFDQYDLWEQGPPRTKDVLMLEWKGFLLDEAIKAKCGRIEEISNRTFVMHGRAVNSVRLFWCRDFSP